MACLEKENMMATKKACYVLCVRHLRLTVLVCDGRRVSRLETLCQASRHTRDGDGP